MHVRNKRIYSANGRPVDRAYSKHELGGHFQSAHHHTPFDVLWKWSKWPVVLLATLHSNSLLTSLFFAEIQPVHGISQQQIHIEHIHGQDSHAGSGHVHLHTQICILFEWETWNLQADGLRLLQSQTRVSGHLKRLFYLPTLFWWSIVFGQPAERRTECSERWTLRK